MYNAWGASWGLLCAWYVGTRRFSKIPMFEFTIIPHIPGAPLLVIITMGVLNMQVWVLLHPKHIDPGTSTALVTANNNRSSNQAIIIFKSNGDDM